MKKIVLLLALINLAACASLMEKDERMNVTAGHVDTPPPAPAVDIPPVVKQVPIIAAPEPVEPLQTFTVVATDLPASELLFALARDARNGDLQTIIELRSQLSGAIAPGNYSVTVSGHGRFDAYLSWTSSEQLSGAARLVTRILGYRIFADDQGKMNLSVSEVDGGVLLVPQFTLAADTNKGMRPSFSSAAEPETGNALFTTVVDITQRRYERVERGVFGADMAVELVNDGPVTFWLRS